MRVCLIFFSGTNCSSFSLRSPDEPCWNIAVGLKHNALLQVSFSFLQTPKFLVNLHLLLNLREYYHRYLTLFILLMNGQ